MRKEWLKSLKVGDRVFIPKTRNSPARTAIISMIGRSWITTGRDWNKARFDKKTGESEQYYGGEIWPSEKDHMAAVDHGRRVNNAFEKLKPPYGRASNIIYSQVTVEQLATLEAMIKEWGL